MWGAQPPTSPSGLASRVRPRSSAMRRVAPQRGGCPGHQVRPRSCGTAADPAGVWGQSPHTGDTRSPSEPRLRCRSSRGRGGCAPTDRNSEGWRAGQSRAQRVLVRDGGVGGCAPHRQHALGLGAAGALPTRRGRGAEPPHSKDLRAGGRVQSRAQRVLVRDGGVGGCAPHRRLALALGASVALPTRRGRGGAAPTERNSEGGRAGPEPRAARARPGLGAWGAQPPIDNTLSTSEPRSRCQPSRGRGGAAPTERNSEGGRVGRAAPQRALSALRSGDDEGLGGALGGAEERRGDQAEEEHGEGGEAE